ncbi:MAG: hypothetical protein ABI114_06385 [Rhodanobacter sp.]
MKSKVYVFAVWAVLLGVLGQLVWSPDARIGMAITVGVTLGLVLLAAATTLLVKFIFPNNRLSRALLRLRGRRVSH